MTQKVGCANPSFGKRLTGPRRLPRRDHGHCLDQGALQATITVVHDVHGHPLKAQARGDSLGELGVVLDQEHPHGPIITLVPDGVLSGNCRSPLKGPPKGRRAHRRGK